MTFEQSLDSSLFEATAKASRERVLRKIRPTGQKKNKRTSSAVAGKANHMKGRIVPNKTADNDPRRNRQWVGEDWENACKELFLIEEPGSVQHLDGLDSKDNYLKVINRIISTRMGGWREDGDEFVNESDQSASPEFWELDGDKIAPRSADWIPEEVVPTSWLHTMREHLEALIKQEKGDA